MRISLTGLFGIVTASAMVFAGVYWFGLLSKGPRDEIRRARIGAAHVKRVGHLVLIRQESEPNRRALQELRALSPPVNELIVTDRAWSDSLAEWIRSLPKITSLRFENCDGFDDRFSEILEESDGLLRLELRGCDISMVRFPSSSALRTLVLDNSNVTDGQMPPIAAYQHLIQFSANRTGLTEHGLAALCDLPLRNVSLIDTPVSPELVERLLENDRVVLIELSELQFEYDAFAKHPRLRRADGGSRVNIYSKNWLKGR